MANMKTISRNCRYQPSARTASPSELPVAITMETGERNDTAAFEPLTEDFTERYDMENLQAALVDAGFDSQGNREVCQDRLDCPLLTAINPRRSSPLATIKEEIKELFEEYGEEIDSSYDTLERLPQEQLSEYGVEVGNIEETYIFQAIKKRMHRHLRAGVERVFTRLKSFTGLDRVRSRKENIDQRSVRSLLASTDSGRVAAEQTDRDSNINTSEHQANAGAGAGPVNVGAGTRRLSQQGNETENVYLFDLIQSKFTRLYEHEKITPQISIESDGTYELRDSVELSELDRGTVLELRGTIQLHPLYRVYRAIEYIDTAAPEECIVAEGDFQLIEESLGDKIPVEIEVEGLSLDGDGGIRVDSEGDAFNVVALLDETELWTEPIQTLASSKQFRVFCRVEAVRSNWYPMKLIRVLESISADLAEKYNTELEGELQAAMEAFEASVEASSKGVEVDEEAVREFAEFLAEKASTSVDDAQLDEVVDTALDAYSPEAEVAIEQEVELLKEIYNAFTKAESEDVFTVDSSSLRSEYHRDQTAQSQSSDFSERDFTAHLEVNVIGIYW